MLAVAAQMLQEEREQKMQEREAALVERLPPLSLSGLSLQEMLVFSFHFNHFKKSFSHYSQLFLFELTLYAHTTSTFFQDLCKELHHKIDVVDEERYDIGLKVSKNDKEVSR